VLEVSRSKRRSSGRVVFHDFIKEQIVHRRSNLPPQPYAKKPNFYFACAPPISGQNGHPKRLLFDQPGRLAQLVVYVERDGTVATYPDPYLKPIADHIPGISQLLNVANVGAEQAELLSLTDSA